MIASTTETIIGDPGEFITQREELGLDELGLSVREADWGDSEVELFLIRQRLGEVPADRHPQNRTVTITIKVEEEGNVSLAEASLRLQQKVGTWQTKGGWIGRALDVNGGYIRPKLGFIVYGANLGGLDGWQMANRNIAPDVTLTLVVSPYCYDSQEVELVGSQKVTHAVWELAQVYGTAPGLLRTVVKDESGAAENFKGMLLAAESWDHPQNETKDTTAAINYGINDYEFWLASIVETGTREGATVAKIKSINAGWQTAISSSGGGEEMTHKGVRRPWIRVWDPGEEAGNVEVRLRWRPLGGNNWITNKGQKTKVVDDWCLIDMQECRLQTAIRGNQQWEWELQVRAVSGAGELEFQEIYLLPTEQFSTVSIGEQLQAPEESALKSAGKGETSSGSGPNWENPENVKAGASVAKAKFASAFTVELADTLTARTFGMPVPAGATITGVMVGIKRKAAVVALSGGYVADRVSPEAVVLRYKGKGVAKSGSGIGTTGAKWSETMEWVYYGGSEELWNTDVPGTSNMILTPEIVNDPEFEVLVIGAEGKNAEAEIEEISLTVFWTEEEDDNVICYVGKAMELRSDGCIRQDSTGEVWGMLTPDFFPWAEPSGLEGKAMRGIVIPSQGSLDKGPDSNATETSKLLISIFYRPAYHFTGEGS